MIILQWIALVLAFAALTQNAFADTVYLTNGNTLEGRVRYEGGKIIIEQASGEITLDKSKVEYVEQGRTAMDDFDDRFKALAAKEGVKAEEFVALGEFAADAKMTRGAEKAYRKAMELEPNNAASRTALGYVKFQGQWLKPDDANRARGMVLFEGDWVTPEAKADLLRLRAQADVAAIKAETERLKAERMERALELVEAQAERDAYYPRNYSYYGGPIIIPSRLHRGPPLPPPTTRPLGVAESIFSQGNSAMK
jgi:hypothetical protein